MAKIIFTDAFNQSLSGISKDRGAFPVTFSFIIKSFCFLAAGFKDTGKPRTAGNSPIMGRCLPSAHTIGMCARDLD